MFLQRNLIFFFIPFPNFSAWFFVKNYDYVNWKKMLAYQCWRLWGSANRLKSWDFQKAHLGFLLNLHTTFQLLSSIWRGTMWGTNWKMRKMRKPDKKKTTSLKLWGRCKRAKKSRPRKNASIGPLLNVLTKIQLSGFTWRGNREGTVQFQGQERGKSLYLPFN